MTRQRFPSLSVGPFTFGALAVGASLALTGCSGPATTEDEHALLRIGSSTPIVFAPDGVLFEGIQMNPYIYDATFTRDGLDFEPWVASEWEWSDDALSLSITLREDVEFTDGTPLDATALKANYDWRQEISDNTFIPTLTSTEVTGDYSVEVHFSAPDVIGAMDNLGDAPLASPAVLESDPDSLATDPVGSGPYIFDRANSTEGSLYSFVRNEDYWNPEAYPYDNIEVVVLEDVTAALNALRSGQVDIASIDAASADSAKQAGLEIYTFNAAWNGLLLGDHAGAIVPAIGDLRVRQAISMAFDREMVVETIYNGYGAPRNQAFMADSPGYLADRADEYGYDPERARELLAEAGYAEGFDLPLPVYPWSASLEGTIPYIKQALGDIGIRVIEVTVTGDEFAAAFFASPPKYAAWPIEFPTNPVAAPFLMRPEYFFNPWRNQDPETDAILAEIGRPDPDDSAYAALGARILDNAWIAVIGQPDTVFAMSSEVTAKTNGWGQVPLRYVTPAE